MTDGTKLLSPNNRGPMNFEEMIAHLRAGGCAKMSTWEWAVLGWSEYAGPHRGDNRAMGTQIFTTEEIVHGRWYPCNTIGGHPGKAEGWTIIERNLPHWRDAYQWVGVSQKAYNPRKADNEMPAPRPDVPASF